MKGMVVRALVGTVVLAALFPACSKFRGSRQLDMGPFAENTTIMLGEAQKIVEPLEWNYLRDYRALALRDSLAVEVNQLRRTFRGIGLYSVQVVSLNAAHLSDKERAARLATYMDGVCRPIAKSGGGPIRLTEARLDSVLTNIRAQPKFLQSIGQADAVVFPVVSYAMSRVDRVAALSQQGFASIEKAVEDNFMEVRRQTNELDALEEREVRTYLTLQDYRAGKITLAEMTARDATLNEFLSAKGRTQQQAVDDAQKELHDRLASIDAVRKQLGTKNELYASERAELDGFRAEVDRRVRSARLMLVYWAQAHRNLSQGVPVPPAIDLGGMLSTNVKKATKAAIP